MDLLELKKAEEIRQQINQLERFISYKPSPFDMFFITKKPKFILGIKMRFLFGEQTMEITSEILSDAIKDALKQTIKDLKTQLVDLGVEIEEVERWKHRCRKNFEPLLNKKAKALSASANSFHKDYYTIKETESEQG
ncbi:hypothetical protein ACKGNC_04005 [Streptococcus pyogenes]|uniref:hypothetical protein n=1 Tax=Streptococcus pyogenes TaxID=1314 RepID=UPI0039A5E0BA